MIHKDQIGISDIVRTVISLNVLVVKNCMQAMQRGCRRTARLSMVVVQQLLLQMQLYSLVELYTPLTFTSTHRYTGLDGLLHHAVYHDRLQTSASIPPTLNSSRKL
jgi:hypothetical protein